MAFLWDVPNLFILSTRGRLITGVVTATEPSNHGAVTVEINVGGRNYFLVVAGHAEKRCQRVAVCYDPRRPALLTIDDPHVALRSEAFLWLISSIALAILMTFVASRAPYYGWIAIYA